MDQESVKESSPPPFKIVDDEIDGRHLVATKDIPGGKAIFSEVPVAYGPPTDNKFSDDDVCIVCMRDLDYPAVCGRCFWPLCSSECGRSKRHKGPECSTLSACVRKSEDELLPVRYLLPLRLLLMKNRDEENWTRLMDMEDHHGIQTRVRSVEEELNDLNRRELKTFIRDQCGIGSLMAPDDVIDLIDDLIRSSAVKVNCDNQGLNQEFPAFYLTVGLMTHSCVPNTRLEFERDTEFQVTVFSSTKIRKGEKLTRSLLKRPMRMATKERKRNLAQHLIDCQCKRCEDPAELETFSSALVCQKCDPRLCSPILPTPVKAPGEDQVWMCQTCGETISNELTANLFKSLTKELDSHTCEDLEVKYKDFLRTNAPILHPNNFLMVACKESLFSLKTSARDYGQGVCIEDNLETIDMGLDLLKIADVLEPGFTKTRGHLLLTLGSLLQQTLSQEILNRMASENSVEERSLTENQIYSAFHDALFCFEEAKRIQRLDKSAKGKEVYASIKSSIHILKDMKKDFERTYVPKNMENGERLRDNHNHILPEETN